VRPSGSGTYYHSPENFRRSSNARPASIAATSIIGLRLCFLNSAKAEGEGVDLDANESVRHLLERWTDLPLSQIPAACTVSHSLLPKTARLTFCDRCWDDDVRTGSQPHIRRDWTYWATVHCASHRTFLSARYRNLDKRKAVVCRRRSTGASRACRRVKCRPPEMAFRYC
jgi:hypothetical protein